MSFDVWGKRRDPENWTLPDEFVELGPVNLGYTGHEAQEDGGLINMGGRMYDPHLGRMASADPFVVDPTSTQGWNRYAYVLNRPLALTDPSGFMPTEGASGHPGGDEGVAGKGEAKQKDPPEKRRQGGSSQPKEPAANQKPGDAGPTASNDAGPTAGNPDANGGGDVGDLDFGGGDASGGGPSRYPPPGLSLGDVIVGLGNAGAGWLLDRLHSLGPGIPARRDPVKDFVDTMLPKENESQERRRRGVAREVEKRVRHVMMNPPAYVDVSLEVTMLLLGGDLELVGAVVKGASKTWAKQSAKESLPLVAGVVKDKAKKGGTTLKPGRHAKDSVPARGPERKFTQEERNAVNEIGQRRGCHTCGTKNPGTQTGNFVPDHQPPSGLAEKGKPQKLYPHCLSCSRRQGGQVRQSKK